ncbi:Reverse transcriptase, RNA-dependent DNA polymerase [Melia azedarach]|uniref:Reverse transcriptase, RNA-dependent DNA polymerase n=1 Tax=Melia azedarach TaxID=155640 RepID=A0ACC1XZG1_MELAZ|nr:Reverse transcriptase, RNA-dependent DNA polymerase [Melia azedarach]
MSKFSFESNLTPLFTQESIELFPDNTDRGNSDESSVDMSTELLPAPELTTLPSGSTVDTSIVPPSTSSNLSPIPRQSNRVRELLIRLRDYHCFSTTLSLYEPQSYSEACSNPVWQQAMAEELQALEKLVAKEFNQEYRVDYEETIALVARITFIRNLLAVAAICRSTLSQMDVKNSFLNGDFTEDVYMKPPPGYVHSSHKVCKLRRALYGLKQVLSAADGYYLSQAKYASDLLTRVGLTDSKVTSTPLEPNAKLTPLDRVLLKDATLYRQLVGILVYLTVTRPDISHAVRITVVARFSTEDEYRALADTTQEITWLYWLLSDMSVPHSGPTPLTYDNSSAIQIAHNDVFHERTKHIEVDCHFIHQHITQGTIVLRSISSLDQPVDLFTKSHSRDRFCDLLSKLKITSTMPS